jgi:hypothetical protein
MDFPGFSGIPYFQTKLKFQGRLKSTLIGTPYNVFAALCPQKVSGKMSVRNQRNLTNWGTIFDSQVLIVDDIPS